MKEVIFPAINLKLKLSPVAITIFNISIYWYALIMMSAMVIAIIIFKTRDGEYGIKFTDIIDLLIYLIPISIVSARLYYVIFNLDYYLQNPIQILNVRAGGLAIYGGIIGGTITCLIFCKKKKIDIINLLDYLAPGLVLGQSIGRWGNFINVEAYGRITTLPWRMGIIENGNYVEVHPTFLYESIATFMIFLIIINIKDKRKFKGQISCIYLIMYAFVRMIVEGLRTDSLMLGNFRISQILSIIILIVFTIIYVINIIKNCHKKI